MPSPMTISSAASAPINHHLHHHHQQQLQQQHHHLIHHQQQQQQHVAPPPPPPAPQNPLNALIQTGLISASSSPALLHHHLHNASSTTNQAPPPPTSMVSSSSPVVAASIHHPHNSHPHHNFLQTNHLSHGNLLHEIYDISNKRNLMSHYGPAGGGPGLQIANTGPIQHISSAIPGSVPGGSIPLIALHPGVGAVPPTQHLAHIGGSSGASSGAAFHPPSSSSFTPSNHHYYNPAIQQPQHGPTSHRIVSDGPSLSSSSATTGSRIINSNQQEMVLETIDDSVEDGYNPHFEAISPTPQDESRISPLTSLKDQILSSINNCDRKIQTIEVDINTLKSKAQQLEAATRKPPTDNDEEENKNGIKTEPTLVQKIMQENAIKAKRAHQHLNRLSGNDDNSSHINPFPCYNQPMDLPILRENNEKHKRFRPKLIERIMQYKKSVLKDQQSQAEKYDQQMIEWLKKVEKIESNPMKKQRDAKIRESFEKQFPEIRKQREDRERVLRNSTQQHRIRSDAELEEIMDGLQHQELEDKKMRSYVVIPPIKYTERELKNLVRFDNQNGYLADPMALYKEMRNINIWTEGEKEIFREKYLLNPKKFGIIAQFLERKSIADCISYYYLSKKHENYKQLLRKHVKKRTRAMIKAQQQQNSVSQRGSPHLVNSQSQQSSAAIDGSSGSLINRQYPSSTTSVILPYSIPATSSNVTITFTMSLSSSTANNVNTTTTTTSAIQRSSTSTSANGPSIVASQVNISNSDSSINRCDNIDNDLANGTSTPDGSSNAICDNNGINSSIGICLCCNDPIFSTNPQKSRPITQSNFSLYGLTFSSLKIKNSNQKTSNGSQIYGRICFSCHLKKTSQNNQQQSNVNNPREKRHCPIPSCTSSNSNYSATSNSNSTTPKRKKLHLKQLPQQWLDMPEDDIKQQIANELQVPLDIKIGCARCVLRISKRINATNRNANLDQKLIETTNQHPPSIATIDSSSMLKKDFRKVWSAEDQEKLRNMIRTHGKNWAAISSTGFDNQKTPQDCYKAYVLFKSEFQLVPALKEFYQMNGIPWNSAVDSGDDTDGENGSSVGGAIDGDLSGDDTTASSLDGNNNNNESDTASASSSIGGKPAQGDQDVHNATQKSGHNSGSCNLQDFKPFSLSQGSLKSDYDSSATMSADESSNTNENNTGIDRSGSFSFPATGSRSSISNTQQSNITKSENKDDDSKSYASFHRDKLVGFDPPQVPMFLINPNAPSIQISSSSATTSASLPLSSNSSLPTVNASPITSTPSNSASVNMNDRNNSTTTSTTSSCVTTNTTTANSESITMSNNGGGTCVRDLIWKAIEKSLQSESSISQSPSNSVTTTYASSSEPIVKSEPCSTSVQPSLPVLPNNSASAAPLCLKREISTPNPPTQSSSRQPTPDSSKIDMLASTALQQQQYHRSGMNLIVKPEGLAAMNYSYGSSHPNIVAPVEDEVQDLSNKSTKRAYDQTIVHRNSPKDYHQHHSINNKIMKMDPSANSSSSSARSSPLNMPHQVKSPFSHSSIDQPRPPFAHSSNLINNHPASRIPNMIDAFMTSGSPSGVHVDSLKLNRSSGQPTNIYGPAANAGILQNSSLKNSKSPQLPQPPPPSISTPFSISPKAETTIRDKLTNGSITQGTPVILQPGQLGQQVPSPHQQQAAALAAFTASASAASKFPPPPTHAATVLPPPPSHHPPTGSLHPSSIHYNELFQQMNPELAKGSITQGTPLIMPGGNSANPNFLPPGHGTMPSSLQLIPTSQHYQPPMLNQPSRKNVDQVALDFAVAHAGANKRSSSKSNAPIPTYDFIDRNKNYDLHGQSVYHRPFSPNYPTSSKQPPGGNSGTKSDSGNMNQILIDFNTSKQMQPRRSSASSEKESERNPTHQDTSRSIPQPPPSAPPLGVNPHEKHHSRASSFRISPAPSPSAIYLQDRDKGAPILDPQALLHWNPQLAYLSRQNVIQPCYPHQNPPSKGTSVIQSVPPREDLMKNSVSPRIPNANFPSDHDALATLVNAAVQQPSISIPNSTSVTNSAAVSSIPSRLNKEGFEKCFSESFAQHLATNTQQTKQAVSNRIVYPPILNESSHNQDMIADLSVNKSKEESKYNRNRDSRMPPASSSSGMTHAENLDLMAKVAAGSRGFPPGPGMPPYGLLPNASLSEHERLLLAEHQKKKPNFFQPDFHSALEHHQRSNSAAFRPESFGYPPIMNVNPPNNNPGLKFNPFSPEHFERGLKQQVENASASLSLSKNDETKSSRNVMNKSSSSHASHNSTESTMDEASKLFSQSFQKDCDSNSSSGKITAANLIDAIITKQINTDSSKNSNISTYPTSINRLKSSISNNPSPSNTPAPNNSNPVLSMKHIPVDEPRVSDLSGLFTQHKVPPPTAPSGLDLSNFPGSKPSLRDTIFNMITDNIQDNGSSRTSPGMPIAVTSSSRSSKNVRDEPSIVAVAGTSGGSTATTASNPLVSDNFKLRRALQPMDSIDASIHRQQVIHMAGNASTPPPGALPLPSNLKHMSHYIEPISPPQGASSGQQPTGPPANWTNLLNYLPLTPHQFLAPSKIPNNSTDASIHHLPGGHEFFMANRFAEALNRTPFAAASNNVTNSNSHPDEKSSNEMKVDRVATPSLPPPLPANSAVGASSRSSTPSMKKLANEENKESFQPSVSTSNTETNVAPTSSAADNSKTSVSFPDSPSSPGEMVIDENPRPSSTASSSMDAQNNFSSANNNDAASVNDKNLKTGVIKQLNNNSYDNNTSSESSKVNANAATSVTINSNLNNLSYEPLSDDES